MPSHARKKKARESSGAFCGLRERVGVLAGTLEGALLVRLGRLRAVHQRGRAGLVRVVAAVAADVEGNPVGLDAEAVHVDTELYGGELRDARVHGKAVGGLELVEGLEIAHVEVVHGRKPTRILLVPVPLFLSLCGSMLTGLRETRENCDLRNANASACGRTE